MSTPLDDPPRVGAQPVTDREIDAGERFVSHTISSFFGVELLDATRPSLGVWLTATSLLEGRNGTLHGGVVPLLLDGAAYLALSPLLADDEDAVSHDLHFSLLRGVRVGERIELRGSVVKKGRTLAFLEAVASVDGRVVATARITKSLIARPPE